MQVYSVMVGLHSVPVLGSRASMSEFHSRAPMKHILVAPCVGVQTHRDGTLGIRESRAESYQEVSMDGCMQHESIIETWHRARSDGKVPCNSDRVLFFFFFLMIMSKAC